MLLALRSGAAPLLVGARVAGRLAQRRALELPAPRRGLAVASKAALDEIFLASEIVAAPILSHRDRRRVVDELAAALALFEARGWLDAPASYHATPPPLRHAKLERGRIPGAPYQRLRFESGYEPHPGEPGRERWLGYRANRSAYAWILRHEGPPRPWLVCVPGYRMGNPLVDFTGFRVRWLHRRLGLNVAIPVLPLHGPRRIGSRGGDGYFRGDFVDTLHAQSQALWDVRRLLDWLRREGAPRLGLHGVSLGAYTSALVASVDPDLDCVIAGIPAADFPRLVRTHVPQVLFRAAERLGFSFERIERLLHVVSPFAFPPAVPSERCFLYAGLADRLAAPSQARELWEHWGQPRIAWYHGGHVSFLWEPEVRALVGEALGERGFLGHAQG